jgi:uncharacterized protein
MNSVKNDVVLWVNSVVVGLNLCPFSVKPVDENRVRFFVSSVVDEESLLADLMSEMALLHKAAPADIETTLLILPNILQDFYDYTQFLVWAQAAIKRNGWQGIFQLASFHPHYCFAGAEPGDAENLTNRSPYPILHILREASVTAALSYFEHVGDIPEHNKKRVAALTEAEKRRLFPYLLKT